MLSSKYKCLIISSLLYIIVCYGYAAEKVSIERNKQNSIIDLNDLGNDYIFYPTTQATFPGGVSRYKLEQYYQGIPIWDGAVVSINPDAKKIVDSDIVAGVFIRGVENDLRSNALSITNGDGKIVAKISEQQAIEAARNHLLKKLLVSTGVKINHSKSRQYIKLYGDRARLVYIIDSIVTNEDTIEPSRPFVSIDANTGEVLEEWEGLNTIFQNQEYRSATGPGGNEKIGKYIYGLDNRYGYLTVNANCSMSSPNVDTYNMDNKKDSEVLYRFDCPNNDYKAINGAYSPINDAHYFGNLVYNMYKSWFNVAPLNMKLKMRVHYGVNYQNAFWDGKQMTFGDGGSSFFPLTSLNVTAHEISHGFTEQNSRLVYKDQSGAINESFSDMAGEAAEYFLNIDKPVSQRNDWLVGENITKGERGKALRYFEQPSKDGKSIDHVSGYYDGMNPHYSSGVYNRAFYILAHKPNWDVQKAFHTFLIANQLYWTQDTDFDSGACGAVNAATDLDFRAVDVYNAFKAVGVNPTCGATEEPRPEPTTATKLDNGITVSGLSGKIGEKKLFYIEIPKDGHNNLTIWNFNGGYSKPIMQVAYNRMPRTQDFDCNTASNDRYCYINKPKKGKYYINLTSKDIYNNVSLWAYFN